MDKTRDIKIGGRAFKVKAWTYDEREEYGNQFSPENLLKMKPAEQSAFVKKFISDQTGVAVEEIGKMEDVEVDALLRAIREAHTVPLPSGQT